MGRLMESSIHNIALAFYSRCVADLETDDDKLTLPTFGAIFVIEKWSSMEEESPKIHYLNKQACLWRTIITSSLGEGLYPYSRHVRTLDLQNLSKLLMEPIFRNSRMWM